MDELLALLNTPITTASRFAQKSGDAPATVTVITADQIRRRGYRSLLQVLQDLPDFKVEYRADSEWFMDVAVRGVPGHDKFVILLNGMKISAPTNEQVPILENYPVHFAKQIEVVYGPASALYGADAVSGVINIITRDPEKGGEATLALDKDRSRLGNFLWGQNFAGDVQVTVGGQWYQDPQPELDKTWDDFKGFAPQRTNSFASVFGPMTGSNYDPEPNYPIRTQAFFASLKTEQFRFSFFRNTAKTSSAGLYDPNSAIYNEDTFIGHAITVASTTYSVQTGSISLQSSLTASRYDLNPNSNYRNAFTGMAKGYKYAESASYKAEQQAIWTPSTTATVTAGISYEMFQAIPWSTDLASPMDTSQAIKGKILGTPFDADFFPLKYQNTGIYLQAQMSLTTDLVATLGARYDDNSRYGSTVNPRLGLVWHINRSNTLKAMYGSAFLAPSPFAAYAHFGSFYSTNGGTTWQSSFWRLPNPGLEPIKEKSYELSYRSYLTGTLSLSLTAFRSELTNLFALAPDSATTHLYNGSYKGWPVDFIEVRTNLGKQRNTGGTAQLDYLKSFGEKKRISAYLSCSLVDGKVDPLENGKEIEIGQIAPTIIRLGGELVWERWSLSPRLTWVGTQRVANVDPSGKRYTLDGYKTLDLSLRFEAIRNVETFLTVSNTLDAKYRNINVGAFAPFNDIEFKGAPQDPRRIALGVQARF
ncbi:MAG: TonB-dependent receptor [Holophaga sp.]|nr:TonB-dependent receptor [Holophaga sp.]